MKLRMEKDIYTRLLEAEFEFQMEHGRKPQVIELNEVEMKELERWFEKDKNPLMKFEECDKINGMRIVKV